MRCDTTKMNAFLASAAAALVVSIAFIIAAAIANNGFFSAPASPALMVAAAVAAYAAVVLINQAIGALDEWWACVQSSCPAAASRCGGAMQNARNNLLALALVIGILASAALGAAAIAWIPWAGQAPMWVILGSLIVQAALLASLIAFLVGLHSCVRDACSTGSTTGPIVVSRPPGTVNPGSGGFEPKRGP